MFLQLDDWVLCRIYKKSKYADSPSPTSEAEVAVAEQDIAEDQNQMLRSLPSSSKPPPPHSTLISQKSLSFSNLLDATDYSMLSSFLSESQSTPPGFGPGAFNFNSGIPNPDHPSPPLLNNNNTTNSSFVFQKTHQTQILNHPQPLLPNMENNMQKRQLSGVDEDASYPSKKYQVASSCNFPNNTNPQYQNPQWNFLLKQSLLNQQLLLGPRLGFQG